MGIWQNIHTVTTTDVSPDLGEFSEILNARARKKGIFGTAVGPKIEKKER
jgi:hypothetical protein